MAAASSDHNSTPSDPGLSPNLQGSAINDSFVCDIEMTPADASSIVSALDSAEPCHNSCSHCNGYPAFQLPSTPQNVPVLPIITHQDLLSKLSSSSTASHNGSPNITNALELLSTPSNGISQPSTPSPVDGPLRPDTLPLGGDLPKQFSQKLGKEL